MAVVSSVAGVPRTAAMDVEEPVRPSEQRHRNSATQEESRAARTLAGSAEGSAGESTTGTTAATTSKTVETS